MGLDSIQEKTLAMAAFGAASKSCGLACLFIMTESNVGETETVQRTCFLFALTKGIHKMPTRDLIIVSICFKSFFI